MLLKKYLTAYDVIVFLFIFGAPNIAEYVPKNTFIDRRDFASDEELAKFLLEMTEEEFNTISEKYQRIFIICSILCFSYYIPGRDNCRCN